ncbi:hypothetical protein GGX14DRAFT_391190 [Mycena pura]|uniref:Uncharacterized protein n=1 Tax=Mycena pura TaxID=153505 RepID=A0AAD6VL60_9AGAR|nr:hypothetical protein GGX14DRAFT_391190 [Mycena pura]
MVVSEAAPLRRGRLHPKVVGGIGVCVEEPVPEVVHRAHTEVPVLSQLSTPTCSTRWTGSPGRAPQAPCPFMHTHVREPVRLLHLVRHRWCPRDRARTHALLRAVPSSNAWTLSVPRGHGGGAPHALSRYYTIRSAGTEQRKAIHAPQIDDCSLARAPQRRERGQQCREREEAPGECLAARTLDGVGVARRSAILARRGAALWGGATGELSVLAGAADAALRELAIYLEVVSVRVLPADRVLEEQSVWTEDTRKSGRQWRGRAGRRRRTWRGASSCARSGRRGGEGETAGRQWASRRESNTSTCMVQAMSRSSNHIQRGDQGRLSELYMGLHRRDAHWSTPPSSTRRRAPDAGVCRPAALRRMRHAADCGVSSRTSGENAQYSRATNKPCSTGKSKFKTIARGKRVPGDPI